MSKEIAPKKILLITEPCRNFREFNALWAKAIYKRYLVFYKRRLRRILEKLSSSYNVTVLTTKNLLSSEEGDNKSIKILFYDEELFHAPYDEISKGVREFIDGWQEAISTDFKNGEFSYKGLFIPKILEVQLSLTLTLEVMGYAGIIKNIMEKECPQEVFLTDGGSLPERLARFAANAQDTKVRKLSRFSLSRIYCLLYVWRLRKAEKKKINKELQNIKSINFNGQGKKDKILFSALTPRHLDWLMPIIERVRTSSDFSPLVMTPSDSPSGIKEKVNNLRNEGIETQYIMAYINFKNALRLVQRYKKHYKKFYRLFMRTSFCKMKNVYYCGIPLKYVSSDFLRIAIRYSSVLAILYTEAISMVFEKENPKAVIFIVDRRYPDRIFALMAKTKNIPSLQFFTSPILERDLSNRFDIADRVALLGEHIKSGLERFGIDSKRLVIVGNPSFDSVLNFDKEILKREVCKILNISSRKKIVTISSKYVSDIFSFNEKEFFLKKAIGALKKIKGINIILKVHPNEDLNQTKNLLEAWGLQPDAVVQDINIFSLLRASELLIMASSFSGSEAMALGVPVIAIQRKRKDFDGITYMPYIRTKAAIHLNDDLDEEAIAEVFRRLIFDEDFRREQINKGYDFVKPYYLFCDGKSSERIMRLLKDMIGKG